MPTRKQEIHCQLLRRDIAYLQMLCAGAKSATDEVWLDRRKMFQDGWDRAQLLKRAHVSILETGYVDNDIAYINEAFPREIERFGDALAPETVALMLEFYDGVPEDLRPRLTWHPTAEFRQRAARHGCGAEGNEAGAAAGGPVTLPQASWQELQFLGSIACELPCSEAGMREFVEIRCQTVPDDSPSEPWVRTSGFEIRHIKHREQYTVGDYGNDWRWALDDESTIVKCLLVDAAALLADALAPWDVSAATWHGPLYFDSTLLGLTRLRGERRVQELPRKAKARNSK